MHPICDDCGCRLEWVDGTGYILHDHSTVGNQEEPLLIKKPDMELEYLLLEEELIEKRNTLIRLQEEIPKDEEVLRAMRVVNNFLKQRKK